MPTLPPRLTRFVPQLPDAPRPVAADDGTAAGPRCANCGDARVAAYCAQCGQEQHDLHRSLRGVAGELLDNLAGWDGKIPATLRLLLLRPGALTTEFLAGRRARYLRPLRLFLLASVALVLALRTEGGASGLVVRSTGSGLARPADDPTADSARAYGARIDSVRADSARADSARRTQLDSADQRIARVGRPDPADGSLEQAIERAFTARWAELRRLPPDAMSAMLKRAFIGRLGTMLFLLVPVFALFLRLLWRRAPLFYAEHTVFALHAHAQGMLALGLSHLIPGGWGALALAWGPAYLWLALRRVYGRGRESRARTTAKFVALTGTYGFVLAIGLGVTFVVALFLGE